MQEAWSNQVHRFQRFQWLHFHHDIFGGCKKKQLVELKDKSFLKMKGKFSVYIYKKSSESYLKEMPTFANL